MNKTMPAVQSLNIKLRDGLDLAQGSRASGDQPQDRLIGLEPWDKVIEGQFSTVCGAGFGLQRCQPEFSRFPTEFSGFSAFTSERI